MTAAAFSPALFLPASLTAAEEQTLSEAKAEFEKGFKVKMGLPSYRCQTGNTYMVITAGGLKAEGEPMIGWMPTKAQAIKAWLDRCKQYAQSRTGTIYWRELPTLEHREDSLGKSTWEIYCRFAISDQPELFQTVDEMTTSEEFQVGKTVYNDSNTVYGG